MNELDKLAFEAKADINYTIVAFHNPVTDTWTLPQYIQGVGDDAEKAYKIGLARGCMLGQVAKNNIGCEAYVLGTYADGLGKIEILEKPRFVYKLVRAGEVAPGDI